MILHFPNHETLRLALTSGIVPEATALARVDAGFTEDGHIWLQPVRKLATGPVKELHRMGVQTMRSARAVPVALDQQFRCWHQLLPLDRTPDVEVGGKTPVLFELNCNEQLPELVGEMFRLGNDRQSFRHLANGVEERPLLRVIGPPYYSLLRAIEREGRGDAPRAYVEQSPRVWSEIGFRHELADRIQPPAGQMLLLRAPRTWDFIDEAPFRDIYETLDFTLPDESVDWRESQLQHRIEVPLRLAAGGSAEAAELWVLNENGEDEVERLVRNSDDRLLARLAFAVGERDGKSSIVLRVRPSKFRPPVLVLNGLAFRPFLKLPNLFLPVGQRLHPPLRRDAVTKLFAEDKNEITWLRPEADGQFVRQSIPDAAFRPLTDWIDYVMDRESEPLTAWVASHRFDFESFVCADDRPDRKKPNPKPRPDRKESDKTAPKEPVAKTKPTPPSQKDREDKADEEAAKLATVQAVGKPSELQKRIYKLEQEFHEIEASLDSDERQPLWREMAVLHAALKHRHESTVCWSNALWEQKAPAESDTTAWLECERRGAPDVKLTERELDGLTKDNAAQPVRASVYAAYLVSAANSASPPMQLDGRLPILARFLERQEPYLPVRTIWLAWLAFTKLAGGDVLALARARDRLLERLFRQGLRAEFDMPGFLRIGGGADSERFRALKDHTLRLRDLCNAWVVEPAFGGNTQTKAYADMILAFALARLGETQESQRLADRARDALTEHNAVHTWVCDAYAYRIGQAIEGQANQGRLSAELLARLEELERLDRYKIDRLRNYSRILEPTERIDPYRRWHDRYADDLSRDLANLFEVNDRDELKSKLSRYTARLRSSQQDYSDNVRILETALELSSRLGEAFADEMLGMIDPVLQRAQDVVGRTVLLEKGLLVAAHFDKTEYVQSLVSHLERELPEIVSTYLTLNIQHSPENKEKVDTIDSLFSQSFRGMRKLGMRDEIGRLFGQLHELLRGHTEAASSSNDEVDTVRAQKLLLSVACGWFYFGQYERAEQIVEEIRKMLFKGNLAPIDQRTLACAYIRAVGQAPPETGLARIEDLFAIQHGKRNLPRIEDNMTTVSHYSISQIDVVETVVQTLVSDDFTLNADSRRWLDEDEFLVRRRIHADVREAMKVAS
ncbi:MAG: hypothetical protein MI757_15430 [Pirellulales bacterium]|nr:hypothetical protein [Pirellulales bacterium]